MAAQICLLAMVAVALFGAVCDIRSLTIPNIVPMLIAGLFVPYAIATAMPWAQLAFAAVLALGVFAAGFGLFAAGLVGGGDVKLLAAVVLWAGHDAFAMLMLVTALAGGGLALLLFVPPLARGMRSLRSGSAAAATASRNAMPYGIAITAGTLAIAFQKLG